MIIIIFPHEWPHKSPALLQLLDDINKAQLDCELYLPFGTKFNWKKNKVKYFDPSLSPTSRLFRRLLSFFSFFDKFFSNWITKDILDKHIQITKGNILICFDFFCYRYVISKQNFKKKYIFSTELFLYFKNIFSILKDQEVFLIIQSKMRADFLGFVSTDRIKLVDNIRIDSEFFLQNKIKNEYNRNGLLYSGSICKELGHEILRKLANDSMRSYKLTIHGDIKVNAEKCNKLIVIKDFLLDENINQLMSINKVGLVLFDFKNISRLQNFNFETGPSGKFLKYIINGLPVIATKCSGLADIEKFNAGILLKDQSISEISKAYHQIDENYNFYKKGVEKFSTEIFNKWKSTKFREWFL